MFGWSEDLNYKERLEVKDISDIISFMKDRAFSAPEYIYPGSNPGDKIAGKSGFEKHCAECHGDNGEGLTAPGLNGQEFLSAGSNGYILATITIGRGGTNMPAWGYENDENTLLTAKERQDITAYIRSWQRIQIGF
jgi:cytochrome c oxidase cbb3-type subunit 3